MPSSLGEVNVRIGAKIAGLRKGINASQRLLNKTARKFTGIGDQLTSSISLPLAAAGAASVKLATDFQSSMTKISSQVGIAASEVNAMKGEVLQLAGKTARAPKELADAMFFIQSAGLRGKEAMEALEFSAKAAATGFGDAQTVADLLTSSMNAYGPAVLSAEAATDVLAATVREGKASAEELTGAMGSALPIASQMGIKFGELGGSIAAMTRTGTSADEAVTQLKAIMTTFLKPSKEASKIAAKLGISFGDLRKNIKEKGLVSTLNDLQGKLKDNGIQSAEFFRNTRALSGVLDLTGKSAAENTAIMERMKNATGSASEAFKIASQTAEFKFNKALSELKVTAIELGNILLPFVTDLTSGISSLVKRFSGLSSETKKAIVYTAAFAAALGPVLSVAGRLVKTYAAMKHAVGLLQVSMTKLSGHVQMAIVKFRALSVAKKAAIGILGGLAVAVAAGVLVYNKYYNKLTAAEKAQRTLNAVSTEAKKSIVAERLQIEKIKRVLNDETASRRAKNRAISDLKKISPDYFNGLSIEKSSIDQINSSLDGYIERIEKRARLQAANEKLVAIEKELLDVNQQLKDSAPDWMDAAVNSMKSMGNLGMFANNQAKTLGDNYMNNKKALEAQKAALIEMINTTEKLVKVSDGNSGGTTTKNTTETELKFKGGATTRGVKGSAALLDRVKFKFKEIKNESDAAAEAMKRVVNIDPSNAPISRIEEIKAIFKQMNIELNSIVNSGAVSLFSGFSQALGEAAVSGQSFGKSMAKIGASVLSSLAGVLKHVGEMAIKTGVAIQAIKLSLKTLNPFVAIAAGTALVALSSALPQLLSKKVPGFADGVKNFGGGMAIVGERGPELLNLPNGSDVIPNHALNTGGNQTVHVTGQLVGRGNDLVVIIDEAVRRQLRSGLRT